MIQYNTKEIQSQIIQQNIAKTLQKAVRQKMANERTVELLRRLGQTERANRIEQCGTYLTFADDKISSANFCRERLCSLCAWRRHLKITAQAKEVIERMQAPGYIFITLTLKNVSGADLNDTLTNMLYGFKKLTITKMWKRAITGYMRGVEVTYNRHKCTYHPHIHILATVTDTYFEDEYITQAELCKQWRKTMHLDYRPIVDIRGVENTDGAAIEVSKYAAKSDDWSYSIGVLQIMMDALANRRLVGYGGQWKKIRHELKQKDIEVESLTDMEEDAVIKNNVVKTVWEYIPTDGGLYRPYIEQ